MKKRQYEPEDLLALVSEGVRENGSFTIRRGSIHHAALVAALRNRRSRQRRQRETSASAGGVAWIVATNDDTVDLPARAPSQETVFAALDMQRRFFDGEFPPDDDQDPDRLCNELLDLVESTPPSFWKREPKPNDLVTVVFGDDQVETYRFDRFNRAGSILLENLAGDEWIQVGKDHPRGYLGDRYFVYLDEPQDNDDDDDDDGPDEQDNYGGDEAAAATAAGRAANEPFDEAGRLVVPLTPRCPQCNRELQSYIDAGSLEFENPSLPAGFFCECGYADNPGSPRRPMFDRIEPADHFGPRPIDEISPAADLAFDADRERRS